MFYYLEGNVSILEPNLAVIDCNGVGYAVNTSANTIGKLSLGTKARVYTYLHVKEDIFEIFGFATLKEKHCFEMLISVSGVGPKAALSILSSNTPEGVTLAVISNDEKSLTAAQGVGKKIAQRIILELKDKMQKENMDVSSLSSVSVIPSGMERSKLSDAASALSVLGYNSNEIGFALKGIDVNNLTLEEIIRDALKKMI